MQKGTQRSWNISIGKQRQEIKKKKNEQKVDKNPSLLELDYEDNVQYVEFNSDIKIPIGKNADPPTHYSKQLTHSRYHVTSQFNNKFENLKRAKKLTNYRIII